MICKKCGAHVKGISVSTIIAYVLVAVLAVALILSILGIIPTKNSDDGQSSSAKIEGNGFDSPDDAVEAYIKALNNEDIDGMLSTFAIESYVDNFDTKAHIERMKSFTPTAPVNSIYELSDGETFDRDLRIKAREATIIQGYYKMISLNTTEHDGMMIDLSEDGDVDDFMKKIKKNDFLSKWKTMELEEFLDPDEVSGGTYSNEGVTKNLKEMKKIYGCDDIENVCALVDLDGEEYAMFLECVEYDDKWYILSCGGTLSQIVGIGIDENGLIPFEGDF